MRGSSDAEGGLARDRVIVLAGLIIITAFAWAYLIHVTSDMGGMQMGMDMGASMQTWSAMDVVLLFIMWAVMMVAMMLPTATAMILTFAAINRRSRTAGQPYVATAIFVAGYIAVWVGFAFIATMVQRELHAAALLSPMMVSVSPLLGGVLLLAAGVFQLTPLKHTCLTHCRSPLGFLMTDWREGSWGAFVMGLRHGIYCTGCCALLMGLLFVVGVMNLLWVATITLFVLVEKIVPRGEIVGRVAGAALMIAGVVLLRQGLR